MANKLGEIHVVPALEPQDIGSTATGSDVIGAKEGHERTQAPLRSTIKSRVQLALIAWEHWRLLPQAA